MGEFIEPVIEEDAVVREKPKIFTVEFLTSVVKKSIDSGEIPPDHHFVLVAATDENGIHGLIGVQRSTENSRLSLNFIAEHEWTGDNKIGAKVIFSHK